MIDVVVAVSAAIGAISVLCCTALVGVAFREEAVARRVDAATQREIEARHPEYRS